MSKRLVLAGTPNRVNDKLTIPELALAGFLSAVPTTLITAPVERAKVLLQVGGSDLIRCPKASIVLRTCRFRDKEVQSKSIRVCSTSSDTFTRKVVSGAYSGGQELL